MVRRRVWFLAAGLLVVVVALGAAFYIRSNAGTPTAQDPFAPVSAVIQVTEKQIVSIPIPVCVQRDRLGPCLKQETRPGSAFIVRTATQDYQTYASLYDRFEVGKQYHIMTGGQPIDPKLRFITDIVP